LMVALCIWPRGSMATCQKFTASDCQSPTRTLTSLGEDCHFQLSNSRPQSTEDDGPTLQSEVKVTRCGASHAISADGPRLGFTCGRCLAARSIPDHVGARFGNIALLRLGDACLSSRLFCFHQVPRLDTLCSGLYLVRISLREAAYRSFGCRVKWRVGEENRRVVRPFCFSLVCWPQRRSSTSRKSPAASSNVSV
jgi:hypothetical protein